MKRRFMLAITLLGALSATALAWAADSVITIPLAPPPKPKAEEAKAKTDKKTEVAVAPAAEPMSPQAIVTIPPPVFSSEPLFAPGIDLEKSIPMPVVDPALIDGKEAEVKKVEPPALEPPKERLEARPQPVPPPAPRVLPPMPQPKPEQPALAAQPANTLAAAPKRPGYGTMQPIDDYPSKRPSVVIDDSALDRTLVPAREKPTRSKAALPQPKPELPAVAQQSAATLSAPAETKRPLRRGEMEPIDDYRPPKRPADAGAGSALMQANTKPAETSARLPQPKPAAPKPKEIKLVAKGEMEPVDDMPGPKALSTARGKASTFRCFVRDVMAFYDRTHIRCYNKAKNKLNFFAVDTNQPISAALLEKGLAAMQAGKPATIVFAPEAELNPSNCAAANCRRLIDIQN